MQQQYPNAEIITDVASGLNYRRKDLLPYWNDYTRAISSHLVVAYRDRLARFGTELIEQILQQNGGELLVLNQRDLSPPRNSPRIYSPSLLSSLPEPTDSEGTGRKSRKIRIYPDRHQKTKLKLWFDAGRFTYNRTIELLTTDGGPNASWLRIKKDILTRLPDWTKPAPYEVKSHAIRDACLAVSGAKKFNRQLTTDKAKDSGQEGNYARAHFRSRKKPQPNHFHPRIGPQPKRRLPHHPGRTEKEGTNSPRPRRCQAHTEAPPIPPERTVQEDGTPPQ